MVISDFIVNKISTVWWSVSWTATDLSLTSWLFVNGVLQGQYADSVSYNRYAEFSVKNNTCNMIEIHEAMADDSLTSVNESAPVVTDNRRLYNYDLYWDRVDDAVYYNIYQREADLSEKLIYKFAQDTNTKHYFHTPVLNDINGVWYHFRVEAVDFWGNQSTTVVWHYFVYGMPAVPSNITIVDGSSLGLFNISVIA